MCPACEVDASPGAPYMYLNKASFVAADGAEFRLSGLGEVAEQVLHTSAVEVEALEEKAIDAGDADRTSVVDELHSRTRRKWCNVAIRVESIELGGKIQRSGHFYEVSEAWNSASRLDLFLGRVC